MHSVRFYVHNSLPTDYFVESQDLQRCRELLAALEIATATKPLAIHNVYNHLNKLKVGPLLSYLDSCSGHSILLGDFNYHHEDWNGDQKTETSTSGKKFAEGVKAHNYILKTKKGAMTYSNSKDVSKRSSTIDLTFAKGSISASIGYCEVLQVPGFLSDHRVIETSVKRTVKTLVKTMPCWHKITPNKFQRHLKPRLPPLDSPVGNEEQVVALFAKVIDALHVTMMENVPRRSCGLRPQAQRTMQLASKLKKRLAELDDLKKKDQTPKTLKRILFLERDIDKLNTEMWSESDRDKTIPPSARAFFNVFRLARGRSQPLQFAQTPTLKYEGDSDAGNDPQLAVTDEQKIEMIKKVKFRNNNNPESTRILEEPGPRHDPKREDIHIPRDVDAEKLRTIIKGLKNNKAPGPDKVPNEAIKLGMELLLPYFVLGFRACLNLSLHPANFKDSIIVMLLKAGKEPDKPESYRPISLLSTVGKLYERILADMMLDVLKEHLNFLPATQFGNKTTAEALQYLFRIIFSTWCSNSDDVVTILGLDMSSAYDNVYRQKLLQTLYDKGFPMWFVDIIGLVLSLRDATIRLPGIISEPFELNTGIPLGSPISTVLFFFFVSPLVERTFPPRRIYVDGRKETVRLYQFSFVDDVYYIAVSRSYTINCRGLEILHEQMLSIAKELFINFGSHKYHVMHMRLPTVRQPTHNQEVDGGYVHDSDSDKLTQADHQPISLSLRYACRSVAEETNTLVRFHTVLLSELLLRMRHFVAPEMFYEVEEVAPQYIKAIKWRINDCIGYDQHPELPPQDFEDVANFHNLGVLTRAKLDWNDSTLGFQRAIVCTLRQINAKNAADIAEAINEALPGWTKSSSPEELFDMSFDHWDIPSLSCLRQTAKRLQRQRFLESLGNWHRVQDHDSGFLDSRYKGPRYRYRRKYWFSATAVAIRFLKRLSLTQRGYLHKLILNEDRISVGFPESHAIGMIPFCKENPKMHLEQRVDVWNNLVMSSERPTAYRLTNMYFERSEPEAGEYYSLYDVYAPDQDSYFTNWVVHGLEVVKAGMPARSWSVVFDGEPDLNLATDLFTTIIKRTIVWHTFYSDCVSLGLFTDPSHPEYPFATSTSDKRVPERMRSSIFQCNFNLDRPWNLDKIAADHNVHNDEHEGDLSFWLRSTVDDSEPIDFRISSPAVAIGKLRLVCFERETISDH
ncbi:hypothetical protein CEK27_007754 [Fusarium fujikuroi]|nr:hypothetical protein CEK27_007754 [Fusarium fujikuroi]